MVNLNKKNYLVKVCCPRRSDGSQDITKYPNLTFEEATELQRTLKEDLGDYPAISVYVYIETRMGGHIRVA